MAKDPLYYRLLEACASPGCPVCRVTLHQVDRFLDVLFYESVNDIPTRALLRKSRGFCSSHAWRLLDGEVGNALGIAIIYHDVLTNVLRDLPAAPPDQTGLNSFFGRAARQAGDWLKSALAALSPKEPCLACKEREQATALTLAVMRGALREEEFAAALESSEGLCLPHLRLALEHAGDDTSLPLLLEQSRPKLEVLNAELGEFIRKNDYRFRSEGFGSEGSSWRRVISKFNGERES